jgi:hypothetical protein
MDEGGRRRGQPAKPRPARVAEWLGDRHVFTGLDGTDHAAASGHKQYG